MATLKLPYDKTVLDAVLPDTAIVRTLSPRPMPAIDDPKKTFMTAIESPAGTPPLSALASGTTGRVLIIVSDHTRISNKQKILIWLLDKLNKYGIPDERINILVALGSHKPLSDDKFPESIGPAYDRVETFQHDTSGPMTDCGTTSRGTPVLVNSKLKEADLVITYGPVVHHYFAGYGGGRKFFMPGISTLESIAANHSLVFEGQGKEGGRNSGVFAGSLDGNPVHEDMLESARIAIGDQRCISISAVMNPDKEFSFFSAGDIDASHRAACKFIDSRNVVEIDQLADVVLASAGGFPKDLNVIQSHKGMDNACHSLKPGGTLLYLMGCSDGPGNPAIEEFAPLDLIPIRRKLAENYVVYGQTVYAIKEKVRKFNIVLLSHLDNSLVRTLGFNPAPDLDEALRMIETEISSAELIYHIPRADLTVPRFSSIA